MNLTRIGRQFHTAPGVVEQLAADFMLPMPTRGSHLELAHVPRPLRVVSVVLRPRAEVGVLAPPSVVVFTEYEPAVSLETAKARGWEVVPGLPQPPEARVTLVSPSELGLRVRSFVTVR
jgi:hypothetical protein